MESSASGGRGRQSSTSLGFALGTIVGAALVAITGDAPWIALGSIFGAAIGAVVPTLLRGIRRA